MSWSSDGPKWFYLLFAAAHEAVHLYWFIVTDYEFPMSYGYLLFFRSCISEYFEDDSIFIPFLCSYTILPLLRAHAKSSI